MTLTAPGMSETSFIDALAAQGIRHMPEAGSPLPTAQETRPNASDITASAISSA